MGYFFIVLVCAGVVVYMALMPLDNVAAGLKLPIAVSRFRLIIKVCSRAVKRSEVKKFLRDRRDFLFMLGHGLIFLFSAVFPLVVLAAGCPERAFAGWVSPDKREADAFHLFLGL